MLQHSQCFYIDIYTLIRNEMVEKDKAICMFYVNFYEDPPQLELKLY